MRELIDIETLVNICSDFMRIVVKPLNIDPWPWQELLARRLFRSLIDEDMEEVTALVARQAGKSTVVAAVAITCMVIFPAFARMMPWDPRFQKWRSGFWVGVYAPISDQAQICARHIALFVGSEELQPVLAHSDIAAEIVKNSGGTTVLANGSICRARTASPNAHIEGWTYHLIIMDESQDLARSIVHSSLHPMGAQTGATLCKIGTPENERSDFYEAIIRNVHEDKQRDSLHRCHFEFNCYIVMKDSPRYARYIEKEKRRLGPNSRAFQLKYELKWYFDTDLAFSDNELVRMQDVNRPFMHAWTISPTVAGWDVAESPNRSVVWVVAPDLSKPAETFAVSPVKKGGAREDEYAKFVCYQKLFIAVLEMENVRLEKQYIQVQQFCRQFNVRRLMIDQTGMGNPVVGRMELMLPDIDVVGVAWNSATIKSFCYTFYIQEVSADRVTFPASETARATDVWQHWYDEHKKLTKRFAGNYMLCEKPDDETNDDHCDAACLAVWGTKDPLDVQIAQVEVSGLWERGAGTSILEKTAGELPGVTGSRAHRYRQGRLR